MEVDLRGKGAERTLHFRYGEQNLKYYFTDLPDCVEFAVCHYCYQIPLECFPSSYSVPLYVHLNSSHSESCPLLHSQTLPPVMLISGTLNLIQSTISFLFHSDTSQLYFFYSHYLICLFMIALLLFFAIDLTLLFQSGTLKSLVQSMVESDAKFLLGIDDLLRAESTG